MRRLTRGLLPAVTLVTAVACSSGHLPRAGAEGPRLSHGIAVGEVTATTAVIWARCERAALLQVELTASAAPSATTVSAAAIAENDFTAKVGVEGLEPYTEYRYRTWCSDGAAAGAPVVGRFRTAPDAADARPLQFVWSGDLGGQNVCRDAEAGYPILRTIAAHAPDFFVGLGDMIYADNPCRDVGWYGNAQIPGPAQPAGDLDGFWSYWRYNREDPALRQLLATTSYVAVWDDHEIINDAGPHHDTGPSPPYPPGVHLLPLGLKAFLDYNPIIAGAGASPRLYRSLRWGRHLELFILDTRQYRDANSQPDNPRHPKTMLGREQLAWLKHALRRSDATWKVVVSSVPLSVPTSTRGAHDGWANGHGTTGFETELLDILRVMQTAHIRNSVWIATDIHFVSVVRDTPFTKDPTFHLYEVDTGPLNAGVFPKPHLDPTLHPRQLFRFPLTADPKRGYAVARSWFNFGEMRIDAGGNMDIGILDVDGRQLYALHLQPD